MRRIVIAGAGGLGSEVVATVRLLEHSNQVDLVGVLDDRENLTDAPCLGPIDRNSLPDDCSVLIAVGDPAVRYLLWKRLAGAEFATIVHPMAVVTPGVVLGPGSYVAPFAFLAAGVHIGDNVVFTQYSSAGHDSRIGSHSVMSPYATLNGWAEIGSGVLMGTSAVVGPGHTVGEWSKVAAGTILQHSCDAGSLVAGNPPRSRVMFRPPS